MRVAVNAVVPAHVGLKTPGSSIKVSEANFAHD